ncbi:hypothetical protein IWX49DRAFT_360469 [Phyllosticta citricarpa]|uniref:Uncharacterized protein n=1 Tax=Phyllosticta paracitricarpa TaxID=2016321 RepID=A0ABR1N6D0_9PEZI
MPLPDAPEVPTDSEDMHQNSLPRKKRPCTYGAAFTRQGCVDAVERPDAVTKPGRGTNRPKHQGAKEATPTKPTRLFSRRLPPLALHRRRKPEWSIVEHIKTTITRTSVPSASKVGKNSAALMRDIDPRVWQQLIYSLHFTVQIRPIVAKISCPLLSPAWPRPTQDCDRRELLDSGPPTCRRAQQAMSLDLCSGTQPPAAERDPIARQKYPSPEHACPMPVSSCDFCPKFGRSWGQI